MATSSINNLLAQQSQIGEEIQKVIRNYKKDPAERKTYPKYFSDRIASLESHQQLFELNDEKIRTILQGATVEHEYFSGKYFEIIKNATNEYITIFQKQLRVLEMDAESMTSTDESEIQPMIREQRVLLESLDRIMKMMSDETQAGFKPIIEQYWKDIKDIHVQMYKRFADPVSLGYDIQNFLSAEIAVIKNQTACDVNVPQIVTSTLPTAPPLPLPKVSIPKFDGDYLKWQQFHDMFKKMIHEATSIPIIQKMWYLKNHVIGDAERLIRHLSLTERNYTTAWNMLEERFNNKRVLSTALIQRLLDQPTTTGNDANSVKAMHDNIKETLSALNNIGIPTDQWDPLLLCILTKKMDRQNHVLYEQSIQNTRQNQSICEFLAFLEQRFLTLEAINTEKYKVKHNTCASVGAEQNFICYFCKKPNHSIFKCNDFLKRTAAERLNWVQRQKLCAKCFRSEHATSSCSRRDCFKCNKKHNTLLHLESKPENTKIKLYSVSHCPSYDSGQQWTKGRISSSPRLRISNKRHIRTSCEDIGS
jgi:hypothetical protein